MKKILLLLSCAALLCASGCSALRHGAKSSEDSGKSETEEFTVSYAGTGSEESILLKVTCSVSSTDAAVEAASKYAVMGLMFKGCAATLNTPEVSPLVQIGTQLNADQSAWMDSFFRNGGYRQYVLSVAKGSMSFTKAKKGGYSVEAVVSVDKRRLRKVLEDQGIVRRLGFSEHQ